MVTEMVIRTKGIRTLTPTTRRRSRRRSGAGDRRRRRISRTCKGLANFMTLTFGSLFAGIGGIDLGLERAGFRCAWQVEIDPHARRVLAKHWPGVRRWEDVRPFPPEPADDWRCHLIAGGFPCQD